MAGRVSIRQLLSKRPVSQSSSSLSAPSEGRAVPPFTDVLPTLHLPVLPSLSSVSGLKQTLLAESEALTRYSHRVFSAWDFGLSGEAHVRLRQRLILYELQVRLAVGPGELGHRGGGVERMGGAWARDGASRETLGGAFFLGGGP